MISKRLATLMLIQFFFGGFILGCKKSSRCETSPGPVAEKQDVSSACGAVQPAELSTVLGMLLEHVIRVDEDPVYLPTATLPRFYICAGRGVGPRAIRQAQELDDALAQGCDTYPLDWSLAIRRYNNWKIKTYNPYVMPSTLVNDRCDVTGWWIELSPMVRDPFSGEEGVFVRVVPVRRAALGGEIYWVGLRGRDAVRPHMVDLDIEDSAG